MKTIIVHTASELIDHLRPSHPTWSAPASPCMTHWINREEWAFRGQRSAAWQLVPSAFRPAARLGYHPGASSPTLNGPDQQDQERRVLNQYVFLADRVGLEIAGDGAHLRIPSLPHQPGRPPLSAWPWVAVLETLAVLQHHGVPTRLLDFTYNPMVAGFFACYDAWQSIGRPSIAEAAGRAETDRLAVWGVHLPLLYDSVHHRASMGLNQRVIVVTAPRSRNSYLHNQEGLFLLNAMADAEGYPALDDTLEDIRLELIRNGNPNVLRDPVVKIEMDTRWVPEALSRMWNEFFHIARLQPTHDKVVQALRDHYDLVRP